MYQVAENVTYQLYVLIVHECFLHRRPSETIRKRTDLNGNDDATRQLCRVHFRPSTNQ